MVTKLKPVTLVTRKVVKLEVSLVTKMKLTCIIGYQKAGETDARDSLITGGETRFIGH